MNKRACALTLLLWSLLACTGFDVGAANRDDTTIDIKTITHGDRVDLNAHLVAGKYVLFDFYADWCGPCRALEPRLTSFASQHTSKLALRKVDVVNWGSPVGEQYRISSIPHLKLFGPDGKLVAEGGANTVLRRLEQVLGGPGNSTAPRTVRGDLPERSSSTSVVPFMIFMTIIGLVAYLLFFKDSSALNEAAGPMPAPGSRADSNTDGDAIWFAMMQGSLNGPYSADQLKDMARRNCLDQDSRIRRKGDTEWKRISDL